MAKRVWIIPGDEPFNFVKVFLYSETGTKGGDEECRKGRKIGGYGTTIDRPLDLIADLVPGLEKLVTHEQDKEVGRARRASSLVRPVLAAVT